MSPISASSGSSYLSPLQLLRNQPQTEASSGAISSSDQSAPSSALNDINSSLQNSSPSSSTGGTNASPGDLQSNAQSTITGKPKTGFIKGSTYEAGTLTGQTKSAFAATAQAMIMSSFGSRTIPVSFGMSKITVPMRASSPQ